MNHYNHSSKKVLTDPKNVQKYKLVERPNLYKSVTGGDGLWKLLL